VKGRPEVWLLIGLVLAPLAPAQTPTGAVRDLARRVAAALPQEPIVLAFRNASSLGEPQAAALRDGFETELRALGARFAEGPSGAEVRITVSESFRSHLLVVELRRGEEPLVLMAEWPRAATPEGARPAALTLQRKFLLRQAEPILDAVVPEGSGGGLLAVLDPSRITLYSRRGEGWEERQSWAITAPGPWPRDMRGRLFAQPNAFQGYLPGLVCRGAFDRPSLECHAGEDLWPLYSGATLAARAAFHPGRNIFEGPITTPAGTQTGLPPFYSAALAGVGPAPLWVVAAADGRAALFTQALEPAGFLPGWGSDIAGLEAPCGGRQVLATRAGDASGGDAVQAFEVAGGAAVPLGSPLEFSAPVTALWPAGSAAATLVTHDPHTGFYEAYSLALDCGS
jgi:hypothetical protein